MVPLLLVCVGMDESGQRTSIDHQPRDESSKLLWREQVDFEHTNGMRPKRAIPDPVDAELRNYGRR